VPPPAKARGRYRKSGHDLNNQASFMQVFPKKSWRLRLKI